MSNDIEACSNNIQWKGTDVCLDFHCECGNSFHVDGYFAYSLRCINCEKIWKLGSEVSVTELTDRDDYEYGRALVGDQEDEERI